MIKAEALSRPRGPLPPSRLGSDGKLLRLSEDERGESARRPLAEISEIPDDPNDPPDEEWMRGIDEPRQQRPQFKGRY